MTNLDCARSKYQQSSPLRAGIQGRMCLALRLGAAVALGLGWSMAFALNTGTDVDLSLAPAAGSMAGAAFTQPIEPAGAVFGNPATLSQFPGTQFQIAASFVVPKVDVTQSGAAGTASSSSTANNYIIPTTAVTFEAGNGWFAGGGIGVNAGIGADYRTHPITLPSLTTNPAVTGVPLVDELLSFNANLALAKQVTSQTSIGAALTIGFGFAQLGTTGPSGSFAGIIPQFDGTTASVHAIGIGGSLGITHKLTPSVLLSASVKIPPSYNFKNILYQSAVPPIGWQNLTVAQPLQLSAGAAFDVSPNWLLETDVLWKDWGNATTYEDVYRNQYVILLGTQFKAGPWSLRFGYSYASSILRDVPNNTLGGLRGLGSIPLGAASGPLGTEVLKLVQMTLVPVVWKNTLTAGAGFDLTPHVRIDAFGAYALQGSTSRTTSIGAALVPGAGPENYSAKASEWALGAGFHFKY
jgi:long-chain fatty acid transport protein